MPRAAAVAAASVATSVAAASVPAADALGDLLERRLVRGKRLCHAQLGGRVRRRGAPLRHVVPDEQHRAGRQLRHLRRQNRSWRPKNVLQHHCKPRGLCHAERLRLRLPVPHAEPVAAASSAVAPTSVAAATVVTPTVAASSAAVTATSAAFAAASAAFAAASDTVAPSSAAVTATSAAFAAASVAVAASSACAEQLRGVVRRQREPVGRQVQLAEPVVRELLRVRGCGWTRLLVFARLHG